MINQPSLVLSQPEKKNKKGMLNATGSASSVACPDGQLTTIRSDGVRIMPSAHAGSATKCMVGSTIIQPPNGYPDYLSRWVIIPSTANMNNSSVAPGGLVPESWASSYVLTDTDYAWMLTALSLALDVLQPNHPNVFTYQNPTTGGTYAYYIYSYMDSSAGSHYSQWQPYNFLQIPQLIVIASSDWSDKIGQLLEKAVTYVFPIAGIAVNYANSANASDTAAQMQEQALTAQHDLSNADASVSAVVMPTITTDTPQTPLPTINGMMYVAVFFGIGLLIFAAVQFLKQEKK